MAASAVVFTLLGLVGSVAMISVGVGSFQNILGMSSSGNDAKKLENQVFIPVRNVCTQGESADSRENTFTLSQRVNVSLVSEERDPKNDQTIRANVAEDGSLLISSETMTDCVIEFNDGPRLYQVFDKNQPYKVEVTNSGKVDGKPATQISVTEN